MPCSICCEYGHNSKGCWNVCLPSYFDNDLKVKFTIGKMDRRRKLLKEMKILEYNGYVIISIIIQNFREKYKESINLCLV